MQGTFTLTAKSNSGYAIRQFNSVFSLARTWPDGRAVWSAGQTHMVGIFLGYYGAGHLLRNLRHNDDVLCLLRAYKTGTSGEKKKPFLIYHNNKRNFI